MNYAHLKTVVTNLDEILSKIGAKEAPRITPVDPPVLDRKSGYGPRIDPRQARELHRRGLSFKEIAYRLNVHYNTAYMHTRDVKPEPAPEARHVSSVAEK
jgi:hypothetical protein